MECALLDIAACLAFTGSKSSTYPPLSRLPRSNTHPYTYPPNAEAKFWDWERKDIKAALGLIKEHNEETEDIIEAQLVVQDRVGKMEGVGDLVKAHEAVLEAIDEVVEDGEG